MSGRNYYRFELLVENHGIVYKSDNRKRALREFNRYKQSELQCAVWNQNQITLFEHWDTGEDIIREFNPKTPVYQAVVYDTAECWNRDEYTDCLSQTVLGMARCAIKRWRAYGPWRLVHSDGSQRIYESKDNPHLELQISMA